MTRRLPTPMGILTCLVLVAACGGGDDPGAADQSSSPAKAAEQQNQAKGGRDACGLITKEEITAIYGIPVTTKSDVPHPIYATCDFSDPAQQGLFVFGLEVYWQGGRDQWRAEGLGTAGAKRMLEHAEKDVDVGAILKQEALPGLGDQATFNPLLGGKVLKGDTMLTFKFGLLDDPDKHFRQLAEKALARL
jgi:hypothetical protein